MGQTRSRSHHELAQRLDLARRERGLSSRDLAAALSCDPRTIRRYLSGDRQPNRQLVARWEQECDLEPGTLTAFHDRAIGASPPGADPPPAAKHALATRAERDRATAASRRAAPRRARARYLACAAITVLAVAGWFALLRPSSPRDSSPITRASASRSYIAHHFTPSYTGQVWFRINPARADGSDDRRVRIRWGPSQNSFTLKSAGARTLLLRKNKRDDVTFLVKVDPPAPIDFGEGRPPGDEARNVPSGWTKRTSG